MSDETTPVATTQVTTPPPPVTAAVEHPAAVRTAPVTPTTPSPDTELRESLARVKKMEYDLVEREKKNKEFESKVKAWETDKQKLYDDPETFLQSAYGLGFEELGKTVLSKINNEKKPLEVETAEIKKRLAAMEDEKQRLEQERQNQALESQAQTIYNEMEQLVKSKVDDFDYINTLGMYNDVWMTNRNLVETTGQAKTWDVVAKQVESELDAYLEKLEKNSKKFQAKYQRRDAAAQTTEQKAAPAVTPPISNTTTTEPVKAPSVTLTNKSPSIIPTAQMNDSLYKSKKESIAAIAAKLKAQREEAKRLSGH